MNPEIIPARLKLSGCPACGKAGEFRDATEGRGYIVAVCPDIGKPQGPGICKIQYVTRAFEKFADAAAAWNERD